MPTYDKGFSPEEVNAAKRKRTADTGEKTLTSIGNTEAFPDFAPKAPAAYGISDFSTEDIGAAYDASPVPLTDTPTSSLNSRRPRTVAAGYQEYVGSRRAGNEPLGKMTVMFRDGTLYNYYDVTPGEWQNFKASISKGAPWLNTANSKQGVDGLFIGKPRGPADISGVSTKARNDIYRLARDAQVRYETSRVTHVKLAAPANSFYRRVDPATTRGGGSVVPKNARNKAGYGKAFKNAGLNPNKNKGKNPFG